MEKHHQKMVFAALFFFSVLGGIHTSREGFQFFQESARIQPPSPIASTTRGPIHIDGYDWTTCGLVSGFGTVDFPYVLANVIIDAGGSDGIWIENSHVYSIIQNCTILNADQGIFIDKSSRCRVLENTISNSLYGITLASVVDGTVANNTITQNTRYGIDVRFSRDCIIRLNDISWIAGNSLSITRSTTIEVSGNILSNIKIGIRVYSAPHTRIIVNRIENCTSTGLYVSLSNESIIRGNNLQNCDYRGISLDESSFCEVSGNSIQDIWGETSFHADLSGIRLEYSKNCTIRANMQRRSQIGIYVASSANCSFVANRVAENSWSGFIFYSCPQSTVVENNISKGFHGLSIYNSPESQVHHNTFTKNDRQFFGSIEDAVIANNFFFEYAVAKFNTSLSTVLVKENINFTDLTLHGVPPLTYNWTFGNGDATSSHQPIYNYSSAGEYDVCFTVTDADLDSSKFVARITIREFLNSSGLIKVSNTSVTIGDQVQFSFSTFGGIPPLTYIWDFGDGNSSTSHNPAHTYIQEGNFTASLIVTDSRGDSANWYSNVSVIALYQNITNMTDSTTSTSLSLTISNPPPDSESSVPTNSVTGYPIFPSLLFIAGIGFILLNRKFEKPIVLR